MLVTAETSNPENFLSQIKNPEGKLKEIPNAFEEHFFLCLQYMWKIFKKL